MNENAPTPAPDGARRLGLLDLVFIGCGATFGSGWLFAASKVAGMAGAYSLYSWAVGGLIALLLGFIYCELGAALPKTGGVVRYPYISHGDFLGFNISLVTLVAFSSIVAIEVVAARQYASGAFPFLGYADGSPTLAGWLVQFAFLLFAYFINRKSAKSFAWVNNIVTTLKFSVPFLSIIVLATHFSTAPFHVPLGSATPLASVVVALSTGGIIFSYLGLTPIVAAAGEVRNPQRNVPIALCTAVLFTGVVYLALQTVFIGNIPMANLKNGWVDIPGLFPLPFHDIMIVIGAAWLGRLVLVDACISPLGTGNVFMNSTCRVAQAWLEELGAAPEQPDPDKPIGPRAMALSFALCFFWTLPFPSWSSLVGVVSTALVMSYTFVPVIMAALRNTAPDMPRPFRVWCPQVVGPLSFILSSFVILWAGWSTVAWLIGGQFVLCVGYLIYQLRHRTASNGLRSAGWVLTYYAGMVAFAWADQTQAMETLRSPTLLAAFVVFLWGIYLWAARSGQDVDHAQFA